MNFIKQTNMEIKNIFRSKFLLILGILVLLVSVAIPVISTLTSSENDGYHAYLSVVAEEAMYEPGFYDSGQEAIVVDGVTVKPDNPYYWEIQSLVNIEDYLDQAYFEHPESMNLALDVADMQLQYYLKCAQAILTYDDYRVNLTYDLKPLFDKYLYENADTTDREVLIEAINYRYYVDPETFDDTYVNITPEERQAAIDELDNYLERLYRVLEDNDFEEYIAMSIEQQQNQISSLEEQIKIQEELIIENPDQEEGLSRYIEDLKKQIAVIETGTIPMLEYRLEKHIIPGEDVWQNRAISSIENATSNIQYTNILTEEEFRQDRYAVQEYKTYARYLDAMQKKINYFNEQILIAQNSLDADKPDMSFEPKGARAKTTEFLYYSIFVAMFGVVLGGWVMASEFQMGTIRLLMIRPKTRTKILLSKFTGALLICLALYLTGTILNIITNGICYGFSDLAYPNYTASGEIGFFAYYVPKFLACIVPVVFGYSVAFFLSTVVRNIAVSIAVPIVCLIGCFISMNILAYSGANWLAWTPIPYVLTYQFFSQYSMFRQLMLNGAPFNLAYGLSLLGVLSAIAVFVSAWVFKKRDITN